ncbi:MAG: DUF1893 domain-containing protein [Armatimonadota bacterium]|nr:DUF1893 domain-containing protein [Armatimonadota bacterium]
MSAAIDGAVRSDLALAVAVLRGGDASFVLVARGRVLAQGRRPGVLPLVAAVKALRAREQRATALADRVLGRAALFAAVAVGVRAAHGDVVSRAAADEARARGVVLSWEVLVPAILNRHGTGGCPFEAAVAGCREPLEALRLLHATAMSMQKGVRP